MNTHFFNAATQEHLWTSDINDFVPHVGDVMVTHDAKTYTIVQRTFVSTIVDAVPTGGPINIARASAKQLQVELQILMMEITPATAQNNPSKVEGMPQ